MYRRLTAVAVLASALFVGACGNSTPTAAPDPGVDVAAGEVGDDGAKLQGLMLAAASKVAESSSSRYEMVMRMPGPDGSPAEVTSTGAVDNRTGFTSMEMDLSSMGIPGGDGRTTALFDGEAFYYRFPTALRAAFGGKEWVRMGLDTLSKASGFDLASIMQQFKQSDPATNTAMMAASATDIEEVGTEVIRGAATRHFKMTIDLQNAVANSPEQVRAAVGQIVNMLGHGTYPAEMWIGDDGLPRRLVYSMDLSKAKLPQGAPATGVVDIRMELFDFGVDVGVKVPPASATADFADLLN
jgi:hypothetical protein